MVPVADEEGRIKCSICGGEIKLVHYTRKRAICQKCWDKMNKEAKQVDTNLQGLWWARDEYK